MNKFESIVEEQMSTIRKTQTMRFPRQIKFSEEFLESIAKEYYTQILSESPEAPVKNRPTKFIKALEFVVADLVKNEDENKQKYNTLQEDTEEYTAGCKSKPALKKGDNAKKEKQTQDAVLAQNTLEEGIKSVRYKKGDRVQPKNKPYSNRGPGTVIKLDVKTDPAGVPLYRTATVKFDSGAKDLIVPFENLTKLSDGGLAQNTLEEAYEGIDSGLRSIQVDMLIAKVLELAEEGDVGNNLSSALLHLVNTAYKKGKGEGSSDWRGAQGGPGYGFTDEWGVRG